MASLREIRRKIKSVSSTLSVTKAMKMVAAARLNKAQARILSARPFALKLQQMLEEIDAQMDTSLGKETHAHPMLTYQRLSNFLLEFVSLVKDFFKKSNTLFMIDHKV